MAKKGKYDKQHMVNLAQYERQVDLLYEQAIGEAVQLGVSLGDFDHSKPFSFGDYPLAEKKADKLVKWLQKGLTQTIMGGVAKEWALSNEKNDAMAKYLCGKDADQLPDILRRKFYNHNGEAEQTFKERKVKGLDLSDRVWRYTDQFKNEVELGLDLGIRSGRSAADISRDIRLYLQEPDRLFRRVRTGMVDDEGNPIWRLSKAAEMFHPGAGVYRSSYKNARRLAATETNIAYRTADHTRWQQMDFVLGQHVLLSNNHTLNGHKFLDMCDELSGKDEDDKKGRYPKDFKFTGWHPLCRCFVVPILPTDEQMDAYMDAQLEGKPYKFEGEVRDMPQGFADYVERNADRIKAAGQRGTLPYFIKDNKHRVYASISDSSHKKRVPHKLSRNRKAEKEAAKSYKKNKTSFEFSNEQQKNFTELSKELGVSKGKPMTFEEANKGHANLYRDDENCAKCVVVHELRLRGFDITATIGEYEPIALSTNSAWLNKNGKMPEPTEILKSDVLSEIDKNSSSIGARYHIGWDYDDKNGHIITAERTKDGLVFYDPQDSSNWSIHDIIDSMKDDSKLQILRVDRLLVNPNIIKILAEASF